MLNSDDCAFSVTHPVSDLLDLAAFGCMGPISTYLADIVILHKLSKACVSYIRDGFLRGEKVRLCGVKEDICG